MISKFVLICDLLEGERLCLRISPKWLATFDARLLSILNFVFGRVLGPALMPPQTRAQIHLRAALLSSKNVGAAIVIRACSDTLLGS